MSFNIDSSSPCGFNEIKALQQLLYPKQDSSDDSSEDEANTNHNEKIGPAELVSDIQKKPVQLKKGVKEDQQNLLPAEMETEEKDDIENWLEKQHKEDLDVLETRKQPEYSIIYKQVVGTEDIFLGITNRTPSSMSCEDMIIKIEMPEENVSVDAMNLDVTESNIDLKTSIYRLKLPLVHPINPDKGSAHFDTDQKCLILTLRMKRELDFANF